MSKGRVPKRTEDRLGNVTKAEKDAITRAPGATGVEPPPADELWHSLAIRWYNSLAESGQARFYQPSDWMVAQYLAEAMSRNLEAERFSANLFAAVMSGMTELMATEGARRRLRLELQAAVEEPDDTGEAEVTRLDEYRDLYG